MIWVMVVAKTMCHVVRKRAVTQSCQLSVLLVSEAGCWSRGPGGSRSYGSLYDRDVLLADAISWEAIFETACLAVEDLLNFAVARTHLLKMITPELQAIQTLHRHRINQYRSPRMCVAHHCGHFQRRHRTPPPTSKTWGLCRPECWAFGVVRTRCRRPGEGRWTWVQEERRPVGGHHPRASSPPHPNPAGFPLLQTWWTISVESRR